MTEEVKAVVDAELAQQAQDAECKPKRTPGRRPLNHPFRDKYKKMVPVRAPEDRVVLESREVDGSVRIRVKEEPFG